MYTSSNTNSNNNNDNSNGNSSYYIYDCYLKIKQSIKLKYVLSAMQYSVFRPALCGLFYAVNCDLSFICCYLSP